MKKFMKITTGIVAKIAIVAITMATAYGVNSVWGDVGVYALLGVVLVGWIVAGFIPNKQALAYAEMQVNLAVSEGEVERLRAERDKLILHTVELAEELAEAEAGLKNASGTIAELKGLCEDSDAKLKDATEKSEYITVERNKYYAAWEEATKREEMLHRQLREKQGVVEYFRSRYNALKSEAEVRKTDDSAFEGTDIATADDVEREGAVEVAVAEARSEEVDVEVASVPAPAPRRHKIKRQHRNPSQS